MRENIFYKSPLTEDLSLSLKFPLFGMNKLVELIFSGYDSKGAVI